MKDKISDYPYGITPLGRVIITNHGLRHIIKKTFGINKIQLENFKLLLGIMYKNFPNTTFSGIVEENISNKILIDELVNQNIFIRYKREKGYVYLIGPNGINLISQWQMEKLTRWIAVLTIVLVVIGFAQIVLFFFI